MSIALIAGLMLPPATAYSTESKVVANAPMGDMSDMMPMQGEEECCKTPTGQVPDCGVACPMVVGCFAKCVLSAASGVSPTIPHGEAMAPPRDDGLGAMWLGTPLYEPPRI
ncbi:hypothetical protein WH91_18715 [Devosia psychrophila]|uniref:Uncharacterized protein n=1 Tax=Devosia psychrophila TaxID=728005 RepID=A0ABR5DU61_9HYPH|nr:hypothetical protein WH91_18715 [Devosia psychrophila]